jgi:hypothetical protein
MFEKHGGDISKHPTHNPQLWLEVREKLIDQIRIEFIKSYSK